MTGVKRTFVFCVLALWTLCGVAGQPEEGQGGAALTLNDCQRMAYENYPLVRRYGLIEKTRDYDVANIAKGYLPQFALTGKATYQSDVTELPFEVPGVGVIGLPKEQYQVAVEVQQLLWDGGNIRSRKQLAEASSAVDMEQQHVDMYAVRKRVNDLFFGILLLDEQLKQNALLQDDLKRTHRKVSDYMANGIANQSDLDAVSVQLLDTRQQQAQLETSRRAYLLMLSAFMGRELPSEQVLVKPQRPADRLPGSESFRPELRWFRAQDAQLAAQEGMLTSGFMPRIGLFVQGAYGNPGLNMLKDDAAAWWMGGVRLTWNFGSLYTLKNDRRRIGNLRRQVEVQRDVFLFNTRLEATRQDADIRSMTRQMADDDEIIRLRGNIRRSAEAKVENGTMTVTDLLTEITRENMARRTKALHEIQLLMSACELEHTLGTEDELMQK